MNKYIISAIYSFRYLNVHANINTNALLVYLFCLQLLLNTIQIATNVRIRNLVKFLQSTKEDVKENLAPKGEISVTKFLQIHNLTFWRQNYFFNFSTLCI